MAAVEQITEPVATHGEGPVWSQDWGGLRYVDMLTGDVLALDTATGTVARRHVGTVAAALRPRVGGGAVLALERGFALLDPPVPDPVEGRPDRHGGGPDADGIPGVLRRLGELWSAGRPDTTRIRMNDGGCDPHGRFYCGSMAYDATPGAGSLYRLDPDGAVRVVLAGATVSNGLAWSPDGGTAYYVDSPTLRVDAFDYDAEHGLTGRRPLITVTDRAGQPDGIAVDSEGFIWVALWGGGAVCRYAPDGTLDGAVEVPVPRVTACTFGGERLGTLYITTSRVDTDAARYPQAGALFAVDVGVTGLPVLPFAG